MIGVISHANEEGMNDAASLSAAAARRFEFFRRHPPLLMFARELEASDMMAG
jgi:hypothetical protein